MSSKIFQFIGLYFVHWSSFELAIDIGITKLSGLTAKDSLESTRHFTVAQKVAELKRLTLASNHPKKDEIINILDRVPKESLRNVIAHCYMRFGADRVIFLQRKSKNRLLRVEMTGLEFGLHLKTMAEIAHNLAVCLRSTELDAEQHFSAR